MNKAQRIVLVFYCLLVAYCCAWVPWKYARPHGSAMRIGYGWLWAGPAHFDLWGSSMAAAPDYAVIALRLIVLTAICAAGTLLAGIRWGTTR